MKIDLVNSENILKTRKNKIKQIILSKISMKVPLMKAKNTNNYNRRIKDSQMYLKENLSFRKKQLQFSKVKYQWL